jgi:hypothetical protein
MAHFSVKHRRPFRNSFCASRRQRRHTASRCLANFDSPFPIPSELFWREENLRSRLISLHRAQTRFILPKPQNEEAVSARYKESNAAALWRTAAVVRNRRDVTNDHDVQSGGGQSAYRGFAAGTRTLPANFAALHAVLIAGVAGSVQRGLLRGVRCALARTLEADGTL